MARSRKVSAAAANLERCVIRRPRLRMLAHLIGEKRYFSEIGEKSRAILGALGPCKLGLPFWIILCFLKFALILCNRPFLDADVDNQQMRAVFSSGKFCFQFGNLLTQANNSLFDNASI